MTRLASVVRRGRRRLSHPWRVINRTTQCRRTTYTVPGAHEINSILSFPCPPDTTSAPCSLSVMLHTDRRNYLLLLISIDRSNEQPRTAGYAVRRTRPRDIRAARYTLYCNSQQVCGMHVCVCVTGIYAYNTLRVQTSSRHRAAPAHSSIPLTVGT